MNTHSPNCYRQECPLNVPHTIMDVFEEVKALRDCLAATVIRANKDEMPTRVNIIVNGKHMLAHPLQINQEKAVALAGFLYAKPQKYTVTWRDKTNQGSLIGVSRVWATEGMVFNVSWTSNA